MTNAPKSKTTFAGRGLLTGAVMLSAVASSGCDLRPPSGIQRPAEIITLSNGQQVFNPLFIPEGPATFNEVILPWKANLCGDSNSKAPNREVIVSREALVRGLYHVGFRDIGLIKMASIIMAESHGALFCIGDETIMTRTYAESIGLAQIRTERKQNGTGRERDKSAMLAQGDDIGVMLIQLKNAFIISGGGKTFKKWSTNENGAYKQFMPAFTEINRNLTLQMMFPTPVPAPPTTEATTTTLMDSIAPPAEPMSITPNGQALARPALADSLRGNRTSTLVI